MFVVIGTTTADLFIAGVEAMPTVEGDEFTTSSLAFCREQLTLTLGGNGANTAYVLRSLGAEVALCSATGTNAIGERVHGWLEGRGVDLRGLVRREGGTATTTSITDDRQNRLSFYYPGLFPTYSDADLPNRIWDNAHTLLITGLPLLPGFGDDGFARVLGAAKAHGVTTAVDIGPAIGTPVSLAALAPLLPDIDYLITNAYELSIATGTDDLDAGIRQMLAAGAAHVVVKQGGEGALICTPQITYPVPGYPVTATVTVGAGDSFNAGFLFALRTGVSLVSAAQFANATAALVLQSGRSALGAPDRAAVEAFLRARGRP